MTSRQLKISPQENIIHRIGVVKIPELVALVNEEAIKIRHLVCQLHETVNPADKSEDAEYAQISAQARSTWCTLVANYWKLQPQIISEIEHLTGQVKENVDQAIAAQIITGQDIHKIESHDQGEKK